MNYRVRDTHPLGEFLAYLKLSVRNAVTSDRRKKRRLGRVRFSHEPSHSGQISYEAQPELIAAHPLRVMRAILATKAFRVLGFDLAHCNLDRQFRTNR
ncbi:hypothetical protein [Rhizobium leguminosarum]|uniref:hypothetical protein n=1 Tax=Rhizobium leguminosarum TaxID=384 RepID=UPI001441B02A|nr:hypothetical protein [Rhizobium leguminosarum]NKN03053.1 hypothetical protein [Rhizobium leguminosarum bv. viciae]